MILRYELKKVWNKRVNKVALAVALVAVVAFAVFAIGSMRFVDQEGNLNNGVTAGRSLSADKAQWQGELTPDAISQAIERYRAGDWQSTYDIVFLASKMLQGEVSESSDIEAALAADGARIDADIRELSGEPASGMRGVRRHPGASRLSGREIPSDRDAVRV